MYDADVLRISFDFLCEPRCEVFLGIQYQKNETTLYWYDYTN